MAHLRSISPAATPEEIAAILAAVASLQPVPAADDGGDDTLHEWVRAARVCDRTGRVCNAARGGSPGVSYAVVAPDGAARDMTA